MRVTKMTIVRSCEIRSADFARGGSIYVDIKSTIPKVKLQAMDIGSHKIQCRRSGFSINV